MKFCNSCGIEKPLSEFHKRRSRAAGVASHCKECRKAKEKARYEKNRDRVIERQRAYNEKNREVINARQREYAKANPEKIKGYSIRNRDHINKYQREKRRNNPVFRLADNVRRRTNYAIRNGGYSKKTSTVEILGCDWETLKSHLEKQFVDGMNWENFGEWEIDHIIPYASATTEEDVIRLSHYTNLQPLWRSDNRRKSGKF